MVCVTYLHISQDIDVTSINMDGFSMRSTPPLSDSETTSSTRVELSPSTQSSSKLLSPPKSFKPSSVTSSLDFDRLSHSHAGGKRAQRSRSRSRSRSLSLVGPFTKQDRISRFREQLRARYRPRLVHHSPPYELQFAKKQTLDSSCRTFNLQDLHEVRAFMLNSIYCD